jgi:hypothetical protein
MRKAIGILILLGALALGACSDATVTVTSGTSTPDETLEVRLGEVRFGETRFQ